MKATLKRIMPGEVRIVFPYQSDLTQQDGFLHAGVVKTAVDTACGLAELTLMPPESRVLAVEFKINFMSPAVGESSEAIGREFKSGRMLSVCAGTVEAIHEGKRKTVASMQSTNICVRENE